jgi:hypothetical protein
MLPTSGSLAGQNRKKGCRGGLAIGPKAEWADGLLMVLKRKIEWIASRAGPKAPKE